MGRRKKDGSERGNATWAQGKLWGWKRKEGEREKETKMKRCSHRGAREGRDGTHGENERGRGGERARGQERGRGKVRGRGGREKERREKMRAHQDQASKTGHVR